MTRMRRTPYVWHTVSVCLTWRWQFNTCTRDTPYNSNNWQIYLIRNGYSGFWNMHSSCILSSDILPIYIYIPQPPNAIHIHIKHLCLLIYIDTQHFHKRIPRCIPIATIKSDADHATGPMWRTRDACKEQHASSTLLHFASRPLRTDIRPSLAYRFCKGWYKTAAQGGKMPGHLDLSFRAA